MSLPTLIQTLLNTDIYPHPCNHIELIETHISWVLLTGDYAYKIKKPITLPFLDFSALEQRKYYCEQELILNQRFAPKLYLEVINITGSPEQAHLNGTGEVIEYAVKMRQFSPEQQLSNLIQHQALSHHIIDELADQIAAFHADCDISNDTQVFGTPQAIWQDAGDNLSQLCDLLPASQQEPLAQLKQWSEQQFEQLKDIFKQRKQQGFIRNGHGDLHLGNMALINQHVTLFDCLEFNDSFRWVDVLNDLAFILMDLFAHQQAPAAHRLLDRYLQRTGDYQGLSILRFYLVYRALIRAKVATISQQATLCEQYLQLASTFTQINKPLITLTCGVSGSGKSAISQPLLEQLGMIRIRSDVERKRLFGLSLEQQSDKKTIYQSQSSEDTYQRLKTLAQAIVQAGYSVIIDATNLKQAQRSIFTTLAKELNTPCLILHFHARPELLRSWINERQQKGKDASEADVKVMEQQRLQFEPFSEDEQSIYQSFDSEDMNADKQVLTFVSGYL